MQDKKKLKYLNFQEKIKKIKVFKIKRQILKRGKDKSDVWIIAHKIKKYIMCLRLIIQNNKHQKNYIKITRL